MQLDGEFYTSASNDLERHVFILKDVNLKGSPKSFPSQSVTPFRPLVARYMYFKIVINIAGHVSSNILLITLFRDELSL